MNQPFFNRARKRRKLSAQETILAEWRGIELSEQDRSLRSTARSFGALVPKVIGGMGLDRRQADLEILKVWNSLVDPQILEHARPVNIAKGTLFVAVDNNVWMAEIIRYHRHEILKKLQGAFGADLVKRISFRIG